MRHVEAVAAGVGGICIGLVASHIPDLKFDAEINISDILELVVTGSAAIWIAAHLNTKISDRRIEKDMMIDDLKIVLQDLDRCRTAYRAAAQAPVISQTHLLDLNNALRDLSNNLSRSQDLCETSGVNLDYKQARRLQTRYKSVLTGETSITTGFPTDTPQKEHESYVRFYAEVRRLQILINQA